MSDAPTAATAVAVAAHFVTSGIPATARALTHGHIHRTFVVTCAGGEDGAEPERIVVQALNRAVFPDLDGLADNHARIGTHLRNDAVASGAAPLVAQPVPTRAGGWLHVDADGTSWRADAYLDAIRMSASEPATADLRAAAAAFVTFSRALDDLPPPPLVETIPHFHDFEGRVAALRSAIRTDRAGRAGDATGLVTGAGRLVARFEAERAGAPADLPTRVVHNDAKLDNVLVDRATGRIRGIVDLDTVMAGSVVNDFGELARTAATHAAEDEPDIDRIDLDHARFAALAAGYVEGGAGWLLPAERDALAVAAPLLTLENGVRFLTDHLDGDRYFHVDHPGHNAERARAQFRLAELMLTDLDRLRDSVRAAS